MGVIMVVSMAMVVMVMGVIMPVVVWQVMLMGMGVTVRSVEPAHAGAEIVAERAIGHVGTGRVRALPLDMVMMTFLHRADLGFEAQHLRAVLAHAAGGRDRLAHEFGHALGKGVHHLRVVAEIRRLDDLKLGVRLGHLIGEAIDAVDQDAREQEIREHHDAAVAQPRHVWETGLDQREGDAGIAGLAPAEAHPLPQETRDLRHVAVGVGIARPAPDHHEAGFVHRHVRGVGVERALDAIGGGRDHARIDPQLAAIDDLDVVLGGIGVEHGRDVVLGVHRGKEHAGHSEDAGATLLAQPVEPVADHRIGEFEIAVFHRPVWRQQSGQLLGQHRELVHCRLAARLKLADDRLGLGREGLVGLDQVEVAGRAAALGHGRPGGRGGRGHPRHDERDRRQEDVAHRGPLDLAMAGARRVMRRCEDDVVLGSPKWVDPRATDRSGHFGLRRPSP